MSYKGIVAREIGINLKHYGSHKMAQLQKTFMVIASCVNYLNRVKPADYEKYPLAEATVANNEARLEAIQDALNGSGIDDTAIHVNESSDNCIRFSFNFHYMNEAGYYDGWLAINGKIKPSLEHGYNLELHLHNGNRSHYNFVSDYLFDNVINWLDTEINRY